MISGVVLSAPGKSNARQDTNDADLMSTPGQKAYEADVAAKPSYHDGTPRKAWDQLGDVEQWSWERGPACAFPDCGGPEARRNSFGGEGDCARVIRPRPSVDKVKEIGERYANQAWPNYAYFVHGQARMDVADLLAEVDRLREVLRAANHTLRVHGKIDSDTPLHQRISEIVESKPMDLIERHAI